MDGRSGITLLKFNMLPTEARDIFLVYFSTRTIKIIVSIIATLSVNIADSMVTNLKILHLFMVFPPPFGQTGLGTMQPYKYITRLQKDTALI